MLRITQLKLPIEHTPEQLREEAARVLKVAPARIKTIHIIKKSIDARKEIIKFIYTLDVEINTEFREKEAFIIRRCKNVNVTAVKPETYEFCPTGQEPLRYRPVVAGTGPAGLFAAYLLAKHGYRPIVVERGEMIQDRVKTVERFWETGRLNTESNVQFGEGGAGTFSDGKLNTMIKDGRHRYQLVMETFVKFGAPGEILYLNKPHIGTDRLRYVVENMRKDIIRHGGEIRFHTKLTDLIIEEGSLKAIELNHKERVPCDILIPAIGHSARDTFEMLLTKGLILTPKAFAVGLRIEHKQKMISEAQYGGDYRKLPPADYKLTYQTREKRGVYSFCMCPGGFVVDASSEKGCLAVNGMSNYDRGGENANSAIVVTVQPRDFGTEGPLSGIAFQRKWEQAAFQTGQGRIPVQLYGDLLNKRRSVTIGNVKPSIRGSYQLADLNTCLPENVIEALKEGIQAFDHKIKGFASEEAVLSAVESRTSSPVRIQRNDRFEANIKGIYPCGEGAGYAGGITSAAIDGIKVFEAVAGRYHL